MRRTSLASRRRCCSIWAATPTAWPSRIRASWTYTTAWCAFAGRGNGLRRPRPAEGHGAVRPRIFASVSVACRATRLRQYPVLRLLANRRRHAQLDRCRVVLGASPPVAPVADAAPLTACACRIAAVRGRLCASPKAPLPGGSPRVPSVPAACHVGGAVKNLPASHQRRHTIPKGRRTEPRGSVQPGLSARLSGVLLGRLGQPRG